MPTVLTSEHGMPPKAGHERCHGNPETVEFFSFRGPAGAQHHDHIIIMFSRWKDWPFVEFAVRAAWAVPFSKSLVFLLTNLTAM